MNRQVPGARASSLWACRTDEPAKKWRTNVKYIFLAAAFTLATIASANADTTCVVNSPDGELNVRDLTQNGPGRVTGVVKNGYTVTMRDFYFL